MDKMDKKLTDRELIDVLVAWYKLDQSNEELRKAVASYVRQNAAQVTDLGDASKGSKSSALPSYESNDGYLDFETPETKQVTYKAQFEPTDELIGTRGWSIDVWALYYGIEEFFHKISFGLLNMQALAVLFCIAISTAVFAGAWQSMLSSERQKKAAFKTITPSEKGNNDFSLPEPKTQLESGTASASDPVAESNTKVASTSVTPELIDGSETEFTPALQLMESSDWDSALANLKTLEDSGKKDLQPLLTFLKVEALIQKRDLESMELARQLLMDCEWGEFDIVFDLLFARWMLLGSMEDRKRFLVEAASLPESARRRMTTWAQIRNGSKDALTEVTLETNTAKDQSEVCDLLFLASYHFNLGKYDVTTRELLDTQQKLRDLKATGKSETESWLLDSAKKHLSSKIDEILNVVSKQPRKPIN